MKMKSLVTKKGQVGSLGNSILILVIAGTFLILGLVILQSLRDTDIVKQANSGTVYNETLTTVTGSGETVARATAPGFGSFSVITMQNATGGQTITSGNYTVGSTGVITSITSGAYNNTNWNITYSYTYGDEAYVAGNKTIIGLGTFADFWEIIILAIVISLVIGLLLVMFGGRSNR